MDLVDRGWFSRFAARLRWSNWPGYLRRMQFEVKSK
jgi:hypothetical protein